MLLGEELFQDDPDLFRSGVAEGWAMGAVMSPEKVCVRRRLEQVE